MDRYVSKREVVHRPRRHTDRRDRPRFEKTILLGECPVPARVPPGPASGDGTFPAKSITTVAARVYQTGRSTCNNRLALRRAKQLPVFRALLDGNRRCQAFLNKSRLMRA